MIVIHLVITGETAPVAKLDDNDDNEMIEALFVASLMNEKSKFSTSLYMRYVCYSEW
jgi:hypothetical protein